MKSSLQSTSGQAVKTKNFYLNKILGLVIFIGSIKVALLVGILFIPTDMPDIEFKSIVKKFEESQKKAPTDSELRLLARLEAQNIDVPKNSAQTENTVEDTLSSKKEERDILFGVQSAYAAENIPPTPNPSAAIPNPSPLIPQITPMQSPTSVENFQRPDSASAQNIPAPQVQNPYVSSDTLSLKEEELNRREQELRALEQQMQARIKELRGIEGQVEEMVDEAEVQDAEKYAQLIDMYENMKPRQAAVVLAGLEEKVAVKILSGMGAEESGKILSYMDPASAVVLSELMASYVR